MNYKSIGIAMDGNFDIELPTPEQVNTLTTLLKRLMKKYSIPANRIYTHRHFAGYKSCPGKKLSSDWARKLVQSAPSYDKNFIAKWEGKFILDVDDHGKLFYVLNGQRHEIPKGMTIQEFARKFATGFKHYNVLKIPPANN